MWEGGKDGAEQGGNVSERWANGDCEVGGTGGSNILSLFLTSNPLIQFQMKLQMQLHACPAGQGENTLEGRNKCSLIIIIIYFI